MIEKRIDRNLQLLKNVKGYLKKPEKYVYGDMMLTFYYLNVHEVSLFYVIAH